MIAAALERYIPWYVAANRWLLAQGWPLLLALSFLLVAVTGYLIATKQAVLLTAWLIYVFSP
jgi:hypothetical protein